MTKNRSLRDILLLSILVSPILLTSTAQAATNGSSEIKAKAESGGLAISVDNINYGQITIGKEIPTKKGLIHITDRTGGNGWNLSVKSENYEYLKDTMSYKVTTDTVSDVNITDSNSFVLKGSSQLDSQDFEATYSSEWGNAPKTSGEDIKNSLLWTVTPNVE